MTNRKLVQLQHPLNYDLYFLAALLSTNHSLYSLLTIDSSSKKILLWVSYPMEWNVADK